jgi:saccharopine dehydrogenase-like NADP-dependent oxidoreductase
VLLALLNDASWLEDGQLRNVGGNNLMALARPYYISPAFAFVAYPNRNSAPYRKWYNIPEADTVVRGTLRYQGFPEFIRALVQLGWLDAEPKEWIKEGLTWADATKRAVGAEESSERWDNPLKLPLLIDSSTLKCVDIPC